MSGIYLMLEMCKIFNTFKQQFLLYLIQVFPFSFHAAAPNTFKRPFN